jgi:Toprim domain
VNVHSGAFNCHGCGAHGGVYDAALAVGRSPRDAIELMITHGLTERRPSGHTSRTRSPAQTRDARRRSAAPTHTHAASATPHAPSTQAPTRIPLHAADRSGQPAGSSSSIATEHVRRWARALCDNAELLARVGRERGWDPNTLSELGVGFDGERITIAITDQRGALQGVLRLRVETWQQPKVLATVGTRLGLIPHPALGEGSVVLVEGPSDMLAARSAGLPAIAVPGTHAWRAEWASALGGREVTVVMDADRAGRAAAANIARDLQAQGATALVVDLDPNRDDGYDLSDWLRAGNEPVVLPRGRPLTTGAEEQTIAGSHAPGPRAASASPRTANTADPTPPGALTAAMSPARSLRCTPS